MVHNAVADEGLLNYLKRLASLDTCTIGLILGQSSNTKDYIIHFARTCIPGDNGNPDARPKQASIQDIQDLWVADHAKHATRMLPGGIYVLGIFVTSPDDILTPFPNKLKSILNQIHKLLGLNNYMFGNSSNCNKLVINYSAKTQSYCCKSYDVISSTVKPAEIKFQSRPTKWKLFECKYDLDQIYSIPESGIDLSLKRHMNGILDLMTESLKESVFAFDGDIKNEDETIEVLDKMKKIHGKQAAKDSPIPVSIYLPCDCKDTHMPENILNCNGSIKLTGQIASKVWMHPKATFQSVCQSIKEDLIRSMAARLDMHWDSLIEEEHGSPEDTNSIHEPPRRVFIHLPNSEVTLSDYLFPGEGTQEAQRSLQELLDLVVDEKDAIKDIEGQADLIDMYYNNNNETENHERLSKQTADTNKFMYILGAVVALVVLLISLIIHYFSMYP